MIELEREVKNLQNTLFNILEISKHISNTSGKQLVNALFQEGYPFQEDLLTVAHKVRKWHQLVEEKTGLFRKIATNLPKAGKELNQLTADALFFPIKIKNPTINIMVDGKIVQVPYRPSEDIEHAIHTINVTLRQRGYKVRTSMNMIGWEVVITSPTGIETAVVAEKLEEAVCHAIILNVDAEVKRQQSIERK
jgi:hypothetical protein